MPSDSQIVPSNIRAAAGIYFAAVLEDARLLDAMDAIARRFMDGLLPLSRSYTAKGLYRWVRQTGSRLAAADRRRAYRRVLGIGPAGNENGPEPNTEFDALWGRFVGAVASLAERLDGDRGAEALEASRALAANLSLHGDGPAWYIAVELDRDIAEALDVLSSPSIGNAYGTRDGWSLVERVAREEFGMAPDVARLRPQARAGRRILDWLAAVAPALERRGTRALPLLREPRLLRQVHRWLEAGQPRGAAGNGKHP